MKKVAFLLLVLTFAHAHPQNVKPLAEKKDVHNGIYSLTRNLMKDLTSANLGENIVFSSFNIYAAMALAQLGAGGETLKELSQFLHIPVVNNEISGDSHEHLGQIIEGLKQSVDVNVSIADGVFINKNYAVKDSYKEKTQRYYKSELITLDFSTGSETPTKIVNQWVFDKTKGHIPLIYTEPIRELPLLLASAIHFEANWKNQFFPELTQKASFKAQQGQMDVMMMYKTYQVPYKKNEALKFQTIGLPYVDTDFTYYVVLPDEGVSADTLLTSLDDSVVQEIVGNKEQRKVHYAIPKHKVGSTLSLPDTLKKMGVTKAFSTDADFTNIGDGLAIGGIIHKCQVDVMESGTIASAATFIEITRLSLEYPLVEPIEFIVDRPFIFYIHNSKHNTILFSGLIHKPVYS